MLSILIPVYEFNVIELVEELSRQAKNCKIDYEIICFDDGSSDLIRQGNATLANMQDVVWKDLPSNIGRSAIRNKLCESARYPFMLFLDCDSRIERHDYIAYFVSAFDDNTVVYGGRCYEPNLPTDKKKYLRWLYGVERESIGAKQRNIHPYKSFMANNIMIPKWIYQSIRMNEALKGYGHEDTAFGKQLKDRGIKLLHIDNPLCHIGLEDAEIFIKKTEESIKNLAFLIKSGLIDEDVKLYRYYKLLKKFGLVNMLDHRLTKMRPGLLNNLLSNKPDLKKFDYYKLGCLIRYMKDVQSA